MKRYRTSYMIRITTDTGVEGWGECVDWLPTLHKGFHDRFIPFLLGKQVSERNRLVLSLKRWHSRSASAVDLALTDIIAQSSGLSICDLWGGTYRDKIPVYASFQSYTEDSDWQKRSLEAVEQAIANGFHMIKVKIGGRSIREDQAHIRSVQTLMQDRIQMALDANQSYDAAAALAWQPLLEQSSNLLWLEEPLSMKHTSDYELLRYRLPVPLAGGENFEGAADFIPLLTHHAIDYITPDPLHITGLDGYREALALARNFGVRATPHTYDGGLLRLYALFAQACLKPWSKMGEDTIEPVEWDVMENPFTQMISVQPVDSEVTLPSGTGIGVEIDRERLAFYRWDGSSYD